MEIKLKLYFYTFNPADIPCLQCRVYEYKECGSSHSQYKANCENYPYKAIKKSMIGVVTPIGEGLQIILRQNKTLFAVNAFNDYLQKEKQIINKKISLIKDYKDE